MNPRRISPATPTATAPTSSASTRRSGLKRGRAAFHLTGSAYVASGNVGHHGTTDGSSAMRTVLAPSTVQRLRR